MNKIVSLSLMVIFPLSFSQQLACRMKPLANKAPANNAALKQSKEAAVIDEIKSLLQKGAIPSLSFNEWCDTYLSTLITSKKEPVKKLGLTLQNLRQRNMGKISAFQVLPTFEKAVQEYDPQFYIKTLKKPVIIAKGSYWYFSRPKK